MKTHFITCALLATAASSASAQEATAERTVNRSQPAVRVANPPPAPLIGGSDSCTTPDVITGLGQFAFDNTTATTGPEGQSTVNCIYFNFIGINNDVWFVWTATQTGTAIVSTCGLTSFDTKIAVYSYSGACPPAGGMALACNDDGSAYGPLTSKVAFNVTAGQQILIQVGTSPTAPATLGTGMIEISYDLPVSGCSVRDDGVTENALTVTASVTGGTRTTGWLHRYGEPTDVTLVTDISSAWGWSATGTPLPAGLTVNVGLWNDPTDDGDPTDAVLLAQASAIIAGQHTDMLQTIPLPSPTNVAGVFFVGAWVTHMGGFPAPMDTTSCTVLDGDAWFVGDNTGNFDPTNLPANSVQPTKTGSLGGLPNLGVGFPWILRATCSGGSTGTPFCAGDGTGTVCPCANHSAPGADEGCLSSLSVGAKLRATGIASIANDTVALNGTQMSNSTVLYFQGTTQQAAGAGSAFGDGKRCAGGGIARLGTKTNVGGMSTYPQGGDLPVSVRGMIAAPGTRTYQAWYRNAAAFCTASTFNLSNGLEIVWGP